MRNKNFEFITYPNNPSLIVYDGYFNSCKNKLFHSIKDIYLKKIKQLYD